MSKLALQLIKKAKEAKSIFLDLGNCGLIEIPEELFELDWLFLLTLGSTYTQNDKGQNSLKHIPLQFKRLSKLRALYLSGNKIADISPLLQLTDLTVLDLSHNELTSVDLIAQFSNLVKLDLSYNKIKDVSSIKELMKAGIPVTLNNNNESSIILLGNPLTAPPIEIIKQGNIAILNYLDEIEQQGSEYSFEAKMLIIGEGGVGKTTLAYKINNENAPMPEEKDTTRGIAIRPYHFHSNNGTDFQINIWDFGGQAIYHATHQFFLTKRSLYVLVDDTRKDDKSVNDATFNYWLQVVSLFGDGSPLIIVQNEKGDRKKDLDLKGMMGRYDFIKERLSTNLLTGRGVNEIKDIIHFLIQRLPNIGEQIPKNWIYIRKELEELAKTKDHISLDVYLNICSENGITEEKGALQLSSYLHDLGTFLHFQDGSILQDTFILNNQWAIDGVYKVLDNAKVIKSQGYFNKADLDEIWGDNKFKRNQNQLLALMMKFELCYQLDDPKGPVYLAPQLLAAEEPEFNWENSNNLVVRYVYDFMPKGLLSRFIVRKHQYIKNPSLSWRNGVLLERQNTIGLVKETYGSREIVISVKGPYVKELMTLIIEDFDIMHTRFENLKVRKLIPCTCSACVDASGKAEFDYNMLITAKENGVIEVQCTRSFKMVNVQGLFDGILPHDKTAPLSVFLSYSHEDEEFKIQLEKHLAALKHEGKILLWNDRMIEGGAEWDKHIQRELEEAQIILLLISSDFMSSKYIWEVEINKAIQRHNDRAAKVIPIFIRECDFEGMPFAKLQGYPNTKPVDSFISKDEAFTQVAKGIRKDIETWKNKKSIDL